MKLSKLWGIIYNMYRERDEISSENLAGYSNYEFRKILSSDQYTVGKKIADFIKDFVSNYRSIKESAEMLPQPVNFNFNSLIGPA